MELIITGKDFALTPSIKEYVRTRVEKFSRLEPTIEYIKVELDVDRHHKKGEKFRAEGWITTPKRRWAAGAKAEDLRAAIDEVVQKLAMQLRRAKERRVERRHAR